jgi:zinc protease
MQARINKSFYTAFYANSRYGERFPIGLKSTLDTFRHEAVRRFYQDWYSPSNMAVVIVGDIEPNVLERLVREHLSLIPNNKHKHDIDQEKALMTLIPSDTANFPRVVLHIDKELPTTVCETHWRRIITPITTHTLYRQELIRSLTFSLINARLGERAVSSSKPPFRRAFVEWSQHNRLLASASLAVEPSAALFTSYEEALKELRRIIRDGFLQAEIMRTKASFRKSIVTSFNERQNTLSINLVKECVAHALTGSAIVHPEYRYKLDTAIIAEVNAEELRQTAAHFFPIGTPQQTTFIGVPPQDSIGITPERIREVMQRADTATIEPYRESIGQHTLLSSIPPLGKILRERKYSRTGVTEWQLSNGVRVLLKPTDFQKDQILLQSSVEGGLSLANEDQYFAATMAAQLQDPLSSGVGTLSAS